MIKLIKSAAKNSLIYSFGNLSIKLAGLVLIPLYTQYFSVSEFGIIAILEVTSQAVFSIFGLSLYYAFFRWYWDKEYIDKQKSIFFTILFFLSILSVFLTALFLPVSSHFSKLLFEKTDYSYLLTIMFIASCLQIVTHIPATLMRLQERAVSYTFSNIIRLIVTLAFSVALIVWFGRGLESIYEAQIIGHLAYLIATWKYNSDNIQLKFEPHILKGMLKFGFPLTLSSLSVIIISLADRYLLNFINGLQDAGLYSFGYKIANAINLLVISSINLALTPIIYKMMDDPSNKRFYSKIMTYSAYIVMIFLMSVSIFGQELVKLLSLNRPAYWSSYIVIPILSFSVFFGMLKDIAVNGLNIEKKTTAIASFVVLVSILNIALNIVLINLLGMIGAAWASLLSQAILFILIYSKSQKVYYIPYELKKILILIGAGAVFIWTSQFLNDLAIYYRILLKLAIIGIFPFLLYAFNFYEPIEIDRIKNFFRKYLKRPQRNV